MGGVGAEGERVEGLGADRQGGGHVVLGGEGGDELGGTVEVQIDGDVGGTVLGGEGGRRIKGGEDRHRQGRRLVLLARFDEQVGDQRGDLRAGSVAGDHLDRVGAGGAERHPSGHCGVERDRQAPAAVRGDGHGGDGCGTRPVHLVPQRGALHGGGQLGSRSDPSVEHELEGCRRQGRHSSRPTARRCRRGARSASARRARAGPPASGRDPRTRGQRPSRRRVRPG